MQESKLAGKRGLAGTKNVAAIIPHNEPDCAPSPHPKHSTSRYKLLASASLTRGPIVASPDSLLLPAYRVAQGVLKDVAFLLAAEIWVRKWGGHSTTTGKIGKWLCPLAPIMYLRPASTIIALRTQNLL